MKWVVFGVIWRSPYYPWSKVSSLSITTHNSKPDTTLPALLAVEHRRAEPGSWLQSVKTNLVLGILTVLFKSTIYISFGQMGPKIDICPVSVARAGPRSLLDILFLTDKLHWPCESCLAVITITIVIFWSLYHPGTVKNVDSRGRYCVFKIETKLKIKSSLEIRHNFVLRNTSFCSD